MTSRFTWLFSHLIKSLKISSTRNIAVRRKLVPARFGGPKSPSVTYRVEDLSKRERVAQAFFSFLEQLSQQRTMGSNQEQPTPTISPPAVVRGMKKLDRDLFSCTVTVPAIKVPAKQVGAVSKILKAFTLKMQRVKAIAELSKDDPDHSSHKLFLLNPEKVTKGEDFPPEDAAKLAEFDVDVTAVFRYDLSLGYENWVAADILRAILPGDCDGVSGYSVIGHIAHLNLKPEVMDYKHLIGEVILDKTPSVKTVVNKLNTIDNTFRNFQMELLAGEDNFIARAKENGCVFEMDFSKVYWNPRLSTEHQRVVDLLNKTDILYDVFAGVGPFAIPSARKGATVIANDLNPNSYDALVTNVKLNKIKGDRLKAYNMDGREFIQTVVKQDLMSRLKARTKVVQSSVTDLDSAMPEGQSNKSENSGVSGVTLKNDAGELKTCADDETSEENLNISGDNTAVKDISKASKEELKISTNAPVKKEWKSFSHVPLTPECQKLYITMNLPALAIEFLDAFCGLLSDFPKELQHNPKVLESLPTVLCYCFSKSDDPESDVRSRAESIMGSKLPADTKVRTVRNVAPNKEMMCLIFPLTREVVFSDVATNKRDVEESGGVLEGDSPQAKKQKISETS